MIRFKYSFATFLASLILCCSGNTLAQSAALDTAEAEALEFTYLFAALKQDYFETGSEKWANSVLNDLADHEEHFMAVLGALAIEYVVEISNIGWGCNLVLEQYEELFFYCSPVSQDRYWRYSWEGYVSAAAYFEELGIRELKAAKETTDKSLLVDAYTEMLRVAYAHLLHFASLLHDDPFDYEAQLLNQADVDVALTQAIANSSENFVINSDLNDVWYDPTTDGQGFSVSVFEDKGTVFLAWFTYDTELPPPSATANLGDAGQRWLTAQGAYDGTQAELVVYSASGGLFDSPTPAQTLTPIGSVVLQFEDCSTGTVSYEFPGIGSSGSIPIERVASDNIAHCNFSRLTAPLPAEAGDDTPAPSAGSCYVSEGAAPTTFKPLFAVWGNGSGQVFAVGGAVTILHYDGMDWTPMTWEGDFGLEGVWGSSSTNVYAVGGFDGFGIALGKILHYDGSCWREVFSTADFQFTDVWGSSDRDIFATTSRGPILHYDGTGWTAMSSGAEAMDGASGVWGTGTNNVFAVSGDTVWHYDGIGWQPMASVNASSLRRVWGSGATDVFAVGAGYQTEAAIWHYDGSSWNFMPSDDEGMRWSVWGSGPDNVFAVGDASDNGLISHYDGSAWESTRIDFTPTLQGVWGSSANDIFAVGGGSRSGSCCSGEGTILHFDGHTWQRVMEYGRFK